MTHPCAQSLARGCKALGLSPEPVQHDSLLAFLDMLVRWNRAYNLTAVRDPADMVTRHLLDSLAVAPWLRGERLLDVGSGAGLPGVPLAILFPGREFHLLDSNGKKTRFLFQVKTDLGLDNMVVHQARVESFRPETPFDVILSRAFASLEDMFARCHHLLAPGGHCLAMKGARPDAELAALRGQCIVDGIHAIAVPGLDEQRHLVDLALP